jgi:flagellar hook protein FlgE
VFSNDPSANPKTAVGSGAITSMISRNTSQGAMTSTDKVTDLASAGRGYFTLASTDPETGARNVV